MTLDFEKMDGLVPAIVQDADTGKVLMLGFMNDEAWDKTAATGHVTFFSRTRNKLWTKGESSGHLLVVKEIYLDCDRDSVLIKAQALGPGVCHEGYQSCFFRKLETDGTWSISEERAFDPQTVYGGSK